MQFSHTKQGGAKAGKFMAVAGLHVALGVLLIHAIDSRHLSLSKVTDQVLVMIAPPPVEPPTPPVPPPLPPQSLPPLVPPTLVVAPPEVDVAPPPDATPLHASTMPDPAPGLPATPNAVPDATAGMAGMAGAGGSGARAGAPVRTAVLADPTACALPDYPARAARDGITGTTMLAMLVGGDGRVTASRIERSSGSRDLDRAAVGALSLCRFKPATSNGVPEAAWAQLAYVWTLDQ